MTKSILILVIAAAFLSQGCNQEKKDNVTAPETAKHSHTPENNIVVIKNATPVLNNDKLQSLLDPYQQLKDALVTGNRIEVKRAALALSEGAKLLSGGKEITSNANAILKSDDLEKQRELFSGISNSYIKAAKENGLKNGKLYIAYCPMALNDKGAYWLTHENKIVNPYFGDAMLTCGSIEETLHQ